MRRSGTPDLGRSTWHDDVVVRVGYVCDHVAKFEALVLDDELSGDSIEIQRSLNFDVQDHLLDMYIYCIVRAGATHCGGLDGWSVDGQVIHVQLNEAAAQQLELPIAFDLEIDADGAALLQEHLPRIVSEDR